MGWRANNWTPIIRYMIDEDGKVYNEKEYWTREAFLEDYPTPSMTNTIRDIIEGRERVRTIKNAKYDKEYTVTQRAKTHRGYSWRKI